MNNLDAIGSLIGTDGYSVAYLFGAAMGLLVGNLVSRGVQVVAFAGAVIFHMWLY